MQVSADDKRKKSTASKKNTSSVIKKTPPLPEKQVPQVSIGKSAYYNDIMSEVKKSNELLLSLVSRLKKTEARLRVVESSLKNSSSSSSTSGSSSSRRKGVPAEVRVSACQGVPNTFVIMQSINYILFP